MWSGQSDEPDSSGVSVRTLHHYDAMGLLRPSQLSPAGYRLYDQAALERLYLVPAIPGAGASPLREIRSMLDAPQFDAKDALEKQFTCWNCAKPGWSRQSTRPVIQKSGVNSMSFKSWDKTEMQRYAAEAKRRWGATDAYQEYERRAADQPTDQAKDGWGWADGSVCRIRGPRDASPAGPEA